jgi:hypothetical protein
MLSNQRYLFVSHASSDTYEQASKLKKDKTAESHGSDAIVPMETSISVSSSYQ